MRNFEATAKTLDSSGLLVKHKVMCNGGFLTYRTGMRRCCCTVIAANAVRRTAAARLRLYVSAGLYYSENAEPFSSTVWGRGDGIWSTICFRISDQTLEIILSHGYFICRVRPRAISRTTWYFKYPKRLRLRPIGIKLTGCSQRSTPTAGASVAANH